MDKELVDILCCPATRQALHLADAETIALASKGRAEPLENGLVREDGRVLYAIRNGIPILVVEEGIDIA